MGRISIFTNENINRGKDNIGGRISIFTNKDKNGNDVKDYKNLEDVINKIEKLEIKHNSNNPNNVLPDFIKDKRRKKKYFNL